jgi:hypothetical protein
MGSFPPVYSGESASAAEHTERWFAATLSRGAAGASGLRFGKGDFLVATRDLRDPRFSRTVVLLLEHGPEGTLGLIVNRPRVAISGIGSRTRAQVRRGHQRSLSPWLDLSLSP